MLKNWDDIRLLFAIAEHGGIAGASDALHLHEATVERRLADLESAVGRPLFRRVQRRGSTPTAACQHLLKQGLAVRSAVASFEQSMQDVASLPQTVTISAPAAVLQFTLMPALLASQKTAQPFQSEDVAYPLPPMAFASSGPADVTVLLTSAGDMPDIRGDLTVRRVGTMHLSAFAPRAFEGIGKVRSFGDLRGQRLFQRTDYMSVRSMEPWNEVCQEAELTRRFDGSDDIYREFKSNDAITIFPSYSSMYDPEAVRLELDDMPDIDLSVWLVSGRDILKEPNVRKVSNVVGAMFANSPWFS